MGLHRSSVCLLAAAWLALPVASAGPARAADAQEWVEPMKKVHARFTGQRGTVAQTA